MKDKGVDTASFWENDPRKRTEALVRKIEEELEQVKPDAPNVLVLSRYDKGGYYPKQDIEVLGCYFKVVGWREPTKHFGGLFVLDRFRNPQWVSNENCDVGSVVPNGIVQKLHDALRRMAPRGCLGSPR